MSEATDADVKGAPPVRVLIVDDSAVTREVLTALLNSDPEIRVIGQASTGAEAVELTATLRPDLVTMDLMMPGMDGMEATRRIMARHPTPVLFLSSFFDKEGTYSRADAIAAGALDVVEKPALMPDWRWHNAAGKLVQKVKSLSKVPVIAHIHGARKLLAQEESQFESFVGPAADVVAIGASSGGPRVIEALLSSLPSTYALGIVVVQHMTDGFTTSMLRWLQERCALQIKVAEEGDAIVPRRVLFTPETSHLVVGIGGRVHLSDAEPVNGHRPSIDVTFQSVAESLRRAIGRRAADRHGIGRRAGSVGDPAGRRRHDGAGRREQPDLRHAARGDRAGRGAAGAAAGGHHPQPERPARGACAIADLASFTAVRDLIEERCGLRFDDSQRASLSASVAARMQQLGLVREDEYFERLRGAAPRIVEAELRNLLNLVTVTETCFFRDASQFRLLREHIIPALMAERSARGDRPRTIRIWSAGCSSGEEAYSIAITLDDMGLFQAYPDWTHRDHRHGSQHEGAREGAPRRVHRRAPCAMSKGGCSTTTSCATERRLR